MDESLYEKLRPIRSFVFGVDGVLTDGQLLLLENGEWLRSMNIRDGFAIRHATMMRYPVAVISNYGTEAILKRLVALGIEAIYLNVESKGGTFEQFLVDHGIEAREALYIGDDIPDLQAMTLAGVACCPQDAVPEVQKISHYVTRNRGGQGCVREVIEMVMKIQGNWDFNVTG